MSKNKSGQVAKAKIEKQFINLNKGVKKADLLWRIDGRLEWICKHGIGHTVYAPDGNYTHGCDGDCANIKIVEEYELIE